MRTCAYFSGEIHAGFYPGNGQLWGILIAQPILKQLGLVDVADLQVSDGVIEIRPPQRSPREGWAQDSQRLAATGCSASGDAAKTANDAAVGVCTELGRRGVGFFKPNRLVALSACAQAAFLFIASRPASYKSSPADQTASLNASGVRAAMRSKVLAAPDGSRLPCSQSCKVRTDTPSSAENSDCDMPTFALASAAGVRATTVVRAALPAFICRTDASRSFWNCSISASIGLAMFHLVFKFCQKCSRQVVEFCFRIDDQ